MKKRIAVLTSGGDCSGLNAVIEGVVRTAEHNGYEVIGYKMGYDGLYKNEYVVFSSESVFDLSKRGGSVIGNSNKTNLFHFRSVDKDGNVSYSDVSDVAVENMKKDGVEALVVIGGDGSMTSARDFTRKGVKVVSVPKTIDNDVPYTDRSFGYTTAYFHIADALQSIRTTGASHDRVMILEVMGRNAGWLALEGGIGGNADAILIPEINYNVESVAKFLLKRYEEGHKSTVICVSEGAHERDKKQVAKIDERYPDSVKLGGIGALLARQLEDIISPITHQEVRSTCLAYIQRGGDTNINDIVLGFRYGAAAVDAIVKGEYSKMVAVVGDKLTLVPIVDVVGNGPTGETSKGGAHNVTLDHDLIKTAQRMGIYLGED